MGRKVDIVDEVLKLGKGIRALRTAYENAEKAEFREYVRRGIGEIGEVLRRNVSGKTMEPILGKFVSAEDYEHGRRAFERSSRSWLVQEVDDYELFLGGGRAWATVAVHLKGGRPDLALAYFPEYDLLMRTAEFQECYTYDYSKREEVPLQTNDHAPAEVAITAAPSASVPDSVIGAIQRTVYARGSRNYTAEGFMKRVMEVASGRADYGFEPEFRCDDEKRLVTLPLALAAAGELFITSAGGCVSPLQPPFENPDYRTGRLPGSGFFMVNREENADDCRTHIFDELPVESR